MRILIIEDHVNTCAYLAQGFKEHYFVPDVVHDGQEGLFLALQNNYDAIVVDVMMPGLDGFAFIEKYRQQNKQTPVLFLTACGNVSEKVRGIELGADDYMVKPFAFSELLVRIQSLLRRSQPQQMPMLQIADLELDILKHKAMRARKRLHLSAKEFLLLLLLAKNNGQVLSRTYIAEQVWDINFDADTNVIDVAIKRLRAKVDGDAKKKLIHTVRGVGYVFEERD